MSSDNNYSTLSLIALDPKEKAEDDGEIVVTIKSSRIIAASRRSKGAILEAANLVPDVLSAPYAVFEGLKRDDDEPSDGDGWRCYCAQPEVSYKPDGSKGGPYRNKVFLVFVNEEKVVYHWYWSEADPEDPQLPIDHRTRFRKRLIP